MGTPVRLRGRTLTAAFALVCAMSTCAHPSAPASGSASIRAQESRAALRQALEPAPLPEATPRMTPPAALVAADDLVGPFPIPTHARFVRQAGRMSVYRIVARTEQLTRFYRRFGFAVFNKGGDATVRPAKAASKHGQGMARCHRTRQPRRDAWREN